MRPGKTAVHRPDRDRGARPHGAAGGAAERDGGRARPGRSRRVRADGDRHRRRAGPTCWWPASAPPLERAFDAQAVNGVIDLPGVNARRSPGSLRSPLRLWRPGRRSKRLLGAGRAPSMRS